MSKPPRRALVVEDDQDLARAISDLLLDDGLEVDQRHDGESGFIAARDGEYDIILLDLMLPKRNGFSVCQDLREAGVQTPLLILTAKDGELDEIEGLEVGADDFLRKPFERSILIARVHALLRRHERGRAPLLSAGGVTLDPLHRKVLANGRAIDLTTREFALLDFLMTHADVAKTKAEIVEAAWGPDFDGDENIVEVYVGYLRRKLEDAGVDSLIKTVRSVGYSVSSL